jgi:hypothetical protein
MDGCAVVVTISRGRTPIKRPHVSLSCIRQALRVKTIGRGEEQCEE